MGIPLRYLATYSSARIHSRIPRVARRFQAGVPMSDLLTDRPPRVLPASDYMLSVFQFRRSLPRSSLFSPRNHLLTTDPMPSRNLLCRSKARAAGQGSARQLTIQLRSFSPFCDVFCMDFLPCSQRPLVRRIFPTDSQQSCLFPLLCGCHNPILPNRA